MARGKPLGNVPYPRPKSCLQPFAGWMTSVLLATEAANAGKLSGHAQRCRQAHSYQWLGSFGNRGNGRYREELRKALAAISRYLAAHQLPQERTLLRLDGQYGNGSRARRSGWLRVCDPRQRLSPCSIIRSFRRVCTCLPISSSSVPKARWCAASTIAHRFRWDPRACPAAWLWRPIPPAKRRVPLASRVQGIVYELFFTNLPQHAFTACDVVELYLHRGAFEPALSDEDQEHRSRSLVQSLGLGTGMLASDRPMGLESAARTGTSARAGRRCAPPSLLLPSRLHSSLPQHRSCLWAMLLQHVGSPWKAGRFSGHDFRAPARWDAALSS